MKIDPVFLPHLQHLDLEQIENSRDSVFLLDRRLKFVGYNDSYVEFAKRNGEPEIEAKYGLGVSLLGAIDEDLRDYYKQNYEHSLAENQVFEQDYECSSSDTYRLFHQTAYPILNRAGLIITNHCVVEKETAAGKLDIDSRHFSTNHFITQCSNCRKIKDHSETNKWDWIPSLLDKPHPDTSHAICPHCLDHYYPDIPCD